VIRVSGGPCVWYTGVVDDGAMSTCANAADVVRSSPTNGYTGSDGRSEIHLPAIAAAVAEGDAQARVGELALGVGGPLHERDAPRPEVVLEQRRLLVL
jgi:hypothetical protein